MAKQATKRLPAEQRRALVLEAAGRVFGQRGYAAARVEDIAAAAGVTKPMLYRHFDSKKALYLAVLERHREDLPELAGLDPDGGSLAEQLPAVIDGWLAYVEQHRYAWEMLFRDSGGGSEIQRARRAVQARAREVMAMLIEALPDFRVPRGELEPLAELLRSGMAGLALWWADHPEVPRAHLVDAITRVWRGLLGAA
jgi:AcrR family transcriptional regulator